MPTGASGTEVSPSLNLGVPTEALLQMIATMFVDRLLGDNEAGNAFIERMADAIALRFELLDPATAATLLTTSERTLRENHVEWGLDKSTAFGAGNPHYFLSQVIERARARVIKGSKFKSLPSITAAAA